MHLPRSRIKFNNFDDLMTFIFGRSPRRQTIDPKSNSLFVIEETIPILMSRRLSKRIYLWDLYEDSPDVSSFRYTLTCPWITFCLEKLLLVDYKYVHVSMTLNSLRPLLGRMDLGSVWEDDKSGITSWLLNKRVHLNGDSLSSTSFIGYDRRPLYI